MRTEKWALVAVLAALTISAAAITPTGEEPLKGSPAPTSCPVVTVNCPDDGRPGRPITFTANISGGDSQVTPTFKWSVSGGTISSGQGTSSITVNPTGMNGLNGMITATVEVGGYDRNCPLSNSCTTPPYDPPQSRKLDEYGDIRTHDEKLRLGYFAVELKNDPTAQGYLVCYGGRRSRRDEAQRRCDRAKNYLVSTRNMDTPRIVTMDAGYREEPAVELWVVPSGANPPYATPTVDPREVRPPTPPRKAHRRGRR